MNFSEKLIRLRKREGISQEELASYLEVSRQAVSRWEQGTALPDAGNLLKLRQRFGVSLDWLLEDAQGWENLTDGAPTGSEGGGTAPSPKLRKSVLPWAIPLGVSGFGICVGTTDFQDNPDNPIYPLFAAPETYRIPVEGGESLEDLYARTGAFLKEVIEPQLRQGKDILIVGHGAMNASIVCQIKDIPVKDFWSVKMKNAELVRLL